MARAKATAVPKKGAVTYHREELNSLLPQYFMIRDCIDGAPAVKGLIANTGFATVANFNGAGSLPGGSLYNNTVLARAKRYLPQPNPSDQSQANIDRYRAYVERAVFYNVTSRTLEGMVGQLYLIDPVTKLPTELNAMQMDADGRGLSLTQVSKRAVRYTTAFGRAGILVDYPQRTTATTKADITNGTVKPSFRIYPPWDIINWNVIKRGTDLVLSLLVLRERSDDLADDGFQVSPYESYRVLRLDDSTGNYTVELYEYTEASKTYGITANAYTPVDSSGKPFDRIPFTFIGSENNDPAVDKPPLYDMAELNIAHYRNSADFEEMCFLVGQPTVWAAGLSEDWVKNVLKNTFTLGSRAGIPLPVGATCGLLQVQAQSMVSEAMKAKEDQMLSIGAKLVIQKRVQRTATESIVDASSESSVLMNVSVNVSEAFTFALSFACRFVGGDPKSVKFVLNKEFELNQMTMDDVSKLVASWQSGAVAFSEMREGLRKTGIATLDDKSAKAEIQSDLEAGLITGAGTTPADGAPNPTSDPAGHATAPKTRGM